MSDEQGTCAVSLSARPCEWHEGDGQWIDDRYGFSIMLGIEDDPTPYHAAWGEGDEDQFVTLDEAKAWCQRQVDRWVAENAIPAQPAPSPSAWLPIETAPLDHPVLLCVPTRWRKRTPTLSMQGEWFGGYWVTRNSDEVVQRVDPIGWMPLLAPPGASLPPQEQST
jgi:hypothetical protein